MNIYPYLGSKEQDAVSTYLRCCPGIHSVHLERKKIEKAEKKYAKLRGQAAEFDYIQLSATGAKYDLVMV